jgi:transmembrane sensor
MMSKDEYAPPGGPGRPGSGGGGPGGGGPGGGGPSDEAHKAALDWLIRLEESPGDEPLGRAFEAWLAGSAAHRAAWAEAESLWGLVGEALAEAPREGAATPASPRAGARVDRLGDTGRLGDAGRLGETGRPGETGRRARRPGAAARSRRKWIGVAAAAIAACGLLLLLGPGWLVRLQADYMTAAGETRAVELADGSIVQLGGASAIAVKLAPNRRAVTLLSGEALFRVAPDRARPFVASAGPLDAIVVGTVFDLRLGEEGTDLAVREGAVRTRFRGAAAADASPLGPGRWLRVGRRGDAIARGTLPLDQVGAWAGGLLVVKDRSVGDVVGDLSRYYAGRIVLLSGDLARRRVTGVYDLADPVRALRAVVQPYGATVRSITPYLVIVSMQ